MHLVSEWVQEALTGLPVCNGSVARCSQYSLQSVECSHFRLIIFHHRSINIFASWCERPGVSAPQRRNDQNCRRTKKLEVEKEFLSMLKCQEREDIQSFIFLVIKNAYRSGMVGTVWLMQDIFVLEWGIRFFCREVKMKLATKLYGMHSYGVLNGDPQIDDAWILDGIVKRIDFRLSEMVTTKVNRHRDVQILYESKEIVRYLLFLLLRDSHRNEHKLIRTHKHTLNLRPQKWSVMLTHNGAETLNRKLSRCSIYTPHVRLSRCSIALQAGPCNRSPPKFRCVTLSTLAYLHQINMLPLAALFL